MSDTPNPLTEAQPDSISHLMSLNPENLSDDEKRTIIRGFREQRERWLVEEQQGIRSKSKSAKLVEPKPKKVAIDPGRSAADILKDIGI